VENYKSEKKRNIINRLNDIKKSKTSIFKRDNRNQLKIINNLIKVANQTYFSHGQINKLDNNCNSKDKNKDLKKTLIGLKRSSKHKISKIEAKSFEDNGEFLTNLILNLIKNFFKFTIKNKKYRKNSLIIISQTVKIND